MDIRVITKSRGDQLVAAADPASNSEGVAFNALKTLIEYQDFPVDSQDPLRFATCLMKAADRQSSRVVKYLLGRDADMFVTDNVGWNALFWALQSAAGDNTVVSILWHRAVYYDQTGRQAAVAKTGGGGGGGGGGGAAEAGSAAAAPAAPSEDGGGGGGGKDDKADDQKGDGKSAPPAGSKREKQRPDYWRRKLMLSATATGFTVLMFAVKHYKAGKKKDEPATAAKGTAAAGSSGAAATTSGTVAALPAAGTADAATDAELDADAEGGDDGGGGDDDKEARAMNPLEFVVHKLYELKEQHTITTTRSSYSETVKDLALASGAWVALERAVRDCEEKYNRDKKMPPVDLFEATELEKAKAAAASAAGEGVSNKPFFYDEGLKQIYRPTQPDRRCGGFGFDFSLFGYKFHFGAYPEKSVKINKTLSTALKNKDLKEDTH